MKRKFPTLRKREETAEMDYLQSFDAKKCSDIYNTITNAILGKTSMSGLYWTMDPNSIRSLLNSGVLDCYKECINGYLNAVFELEEVLFKKEQREGCLYFGGSFVGMNWPKRAGRGYNQPPTYDRCFELHPDDPDMMTYAPMKVDEEDVHLIRTGTDSVGRGLDCIPSDFKLTAILIERAKVVFGDMSTRENLTEDQQRRRRLYSLGVLYKHEDDRFELEFLRKSRILEGNELTLKVDGKKVKMNKHYEEYFYALPPLLLNGELLTAYARLEFLEQLHTGLAHGHMTNILGALRTLYPVHHAKFMHYMENYPRFPLYSMAARDFDKCKRKHSLLVNSVREYLWRPGGKLFEKLEGSFEFIESQ